MSNAPELVDVPLHFRGYIRTLDARWTIRGAFPSAQLAGTWALGLMPMGVFVKIYIGNSDVTENSLARAAAALKNPKIDAFLAARLAECGCSEGGHGEDCPVVCWQHGERKPCGPCSEA